MCICSVPATAWSLGRMRCVLLSSWENEGEWALLGQGGVPAGCVVLFQVLGRVYTYPLLSAWGLKIPPWISHDVLWLWVNFYFIMDYRCQQKRELLWPVLDFQKLPFWGLCAALGEWELLNNFFYNLFSINRQPSVMGGNVLSGRC